MTNRALLAAVAAILCSIATAEAAMSAPAPAPTQAPAPAAGAEVATEARRLNELVEAYFEDQLRLNPLAATSIGDRRYDDRFEVTISPEWRARAEKLERDYLARLEGSDDGLLWHSVSLDNRIWPAVRLVLRLFVLGVQPLWKGP
jgi:hypothetical protein